jgi:hypothetical protein
MNIPLLSILVCAVSLLLLSPVHSACNKFLRDVAPKQYSLAPGSSLLLNQSFSFSTDFKIFSLNSSSPDITYELWKLTDSHLYTWSSTADNSFSVIKLWAGLSQLETACAEEQQSSKQCSVSLYIKNTGAYTQGLGLSIFSGPKISYSTVYSGYLLASAWNYYLVDVALTDLDLLISLVPDQTDRISNVDLYISRQDDILKYIFPSARVPPHTPNSPLTVLLNSDNDEPQGVYIFGVCGTMSGALSSYTLSVQNNYDGSSGSNGINFSIFAVISILVVIILLFFMIVTCIARRRRAQAASALIQGFRENQALQLQFLQQISAHNNNNNNGAAGAGGEERIRINGREFPIGNINIQVVYNSFFRPDLNSGQSAAPQGATAAEISALPRQNFVSGLFSAEDSHCNICLADYSEGAAVRILLCAHHFCAECIEKWLEKKRNCPLCLQEINTAKAVYETKKVQQNNINISLQATEIILNNENNNNDNNDNSGGGEGGIKSADERRLARQNKRSAQILPLDPSHNDNNTAKNDSHDSRNHNINGNSIPGNELLSNGNSMNNSSVAASGDESSSLPNTIVTEEAEEHKAD